MIEVVIEISGGVYSGETVFDLGGNRKVQTILVGWDNIEAGDAPPVERPESSKRDKRSRFWKNIWKEYDKNSDNRGS